MSVNVRDQNNNLVKIAHGFPESKFNTLRSDIVTNIEMTDSASKDYVVGEFLIMADGRLAEVISPIYQDMTINFTNVRLTTVEEMIAKKANKPLSAVSGNLAALNGNGDLIDAGWTADKTIMTVTPDNPLTISGLKSAQLAIDPIVTFSSAVSSVTLTVANNSDSTAQDYVISTDISESLGESVSGSWNIRTGVFTKSDTTTIQLPPHEVILMEGDNYISSNGTDIDLSYYNGEIASLKDISQIIETFNYFANYIINLINS